MKLSLAPLLISVACCCSCSPSGSQRPANPGGAAAQLGAAADQASGAAADQASGATAEQEDASKCEWQLIDDSMFIAKIEPWPAKEGSATLKAEATIDDFEQKFAGTVFFRVASAEQNSEPWQEMPRGSGDDDESVYFQAPISLGKGKNYIQFRVQDQGDPEPDELGDWKLEVK